jgi:hypothetical protein
VASNPRCAVSGALCAQRQLSLRAKRSNPPRAFVRSPERDCFASLAMMELDVGSIRQCRNVRVLLRRNYFAARAAIAPGGMILNRNDVTFSPGLNGPATLCTTGGMLFK